MITQIYSSVFSILDAFPQLYMFTSKNAAVLVKLLPNVAKTVKKKKKKKMK